MPGPDIAVRFPSTVVYGLSPQAGFSQKHGVTSGQAPTLPVLTSGPVPAQGAQLQPLDTVTFTFAAQGNDIIDRVIIWARFEGLGNSAELIYDSDVYTPLYGASTRAGNTFTIRRVGGWPGAPKIFAHADTVGGGKN